MAKQLPENQRFDRDYLKEYVADFIMALREENAEDAENWINEVSGVMWAMFGRAFPDHDF